MTLTTEQRAAQNRENAQQSAGPKSADGKARTRFNALKHGLRADALAMPGQDPALVATRAQAWNDHYNPQSPGAQHLVNECVRLSLACDQIAVFLAADANRRYQASRGDQETTPKSKITAIVRRLEQDPYACVAELKTFAAGCRWLIENWEDINARRDATGLIFIADRDAAILLFGGTQQSVFARECRTLINVLAAPDPNDPFGYTPTVARARLDEQIAAELASLRLEESRCVAAEEAATLADSANAVLFLIPEDDATARLHLRYQSEARSAFLRAFKQLEITLARDAAQDRPSEPVAIASPNEAAPASSVSPNEPDPAFEAALKHAMATPSVTARRVQGTPTVCDNRGLLTNMSNLYMVPGS